MSTLRRQSPSRAEDHLCQVRAKAKDKEVDLDSEAEIKCKISNINLLT